MHITFLLGNGFDIGLGVDSSYESFYNKYCVSNDKDTENIKDFKDYLKRRAEDEVKKIIDWADFEKAFGEHSSEFTMANKGDYIERFEHFVMEFNKYLEQQEMRIDYSKDSNIGKKMQTAVTTFWHLRPAERESIASHINGIKVYDFITFNYTRTIDKCARLLKVQLRGDSGYQVGRIIHVHGYVESSMIMGVNDPQQITNSEFAQDEDVIREIVKPRQNSDGQTNYEKDAVRTINESSMICIYGMSLGETDKQWWQLVAKWLEVDTNHILVILAYSPDYNDRFPFMRKKVTDGVVKQFLSYSVQNEKTKEQITKQIFVGVNHNIFNIPLCETETKVPMNTTATELSI